MKESVNMSLAAIADVCEGSITAGESNMIVSNITSDSRASDVGSLFVALKGNTFDGHDFVAELIAKREVKAVLVQKQGFEGAAAKNGIGVVICKDTRQALGKIAKRHRNSFNPKVIAVTGTNGKTTTKELIAAVLQSKFRIHKSEKNYNNDIGLPFAVLGLQPEHEVAVFEIGMNHSGEIAALSEIVRPNIGLITCVGEGHLEFLGSVENVARAKMEIVQSMESGSLLILNRDSLYFDLMAELAVGSGMRIKTFGLQDNADIYPTEYSITAEQTAIIYSGEEISAPLYGIHNVYNLLATVAAAQEFGFTAADIKGALADFNLLDGRSQIFDRGYIVINDTYNSNPLSSRYAIRSMKEIFPERRKIAVLSDMKELGEASAKCHRDIGRLIAAEDIDLLCVWGDMADEYVEGGAMEGLNRCRVLDFNTKQDLITYLRENITKQDVVLIKGSRSMKMEEVVSALVG